VIFNFFVFGSGVQRIFIFLIFGSGGQRIFVFLIFGSGGQRIFIFLSLAAVASANAEMLNPGNMELGETIATRNFACQCNTHLFIVGSGSQCKGGNVKSR